MQPASLRGCEKDAKISGITAYMRLQVGVAPEKSGDALQYFHDEYHFLGPQNALEIGFERLLSIRIPHCRSINYIRQLQTLKYFFRVFTARLLSID